MAIRIEDDATEGLLRRIAQCEGTTPEQLATELLRERAEERMRNLDAFTQAKRDFDLKHAMRAPR